MSQVYTVDELVANIAFCDKGILEAQNAKAHWVQMLRDELNVGAVALREATK